MLLFCQRTGQLTSILLDEGKLTDIRTAAAGAVAAKHLAPKQIHSIGILGSGIQARYQLEYLRKITDCRNVVVWGRNRERVQSFIQDMYPLGFQITSIDSPQELANVANLIVTTTPSTSPLLQAKWIRPGTHITAVGADTPAKQELHCDLLSRADELVVDSLSQSQSRGEVFRATISGNVSSRQVRELGAIISNSKFGRQSEEQITIADLTGVAIQDLEIASSIYRAHTGTTY